MRPATTNQGSNTTGASWAKRSKTLAGHRRRKNYVVESEINGLWESDNTASHFAVHRNPKSSLDSGCVRGNFCVQRKCGMGRDYAALICIKRCMCRRLHELLSFLDKQTPTFGSLDPNVGAAGPLLPGQLKIYRWGVNFLVDRIPGWASEHSELKNHTAACREKPHP
jgi:hypothetical protein